LPAGAVVQVLRQVINERGAPAYLRSDNGPGYCSGGARMGCNK